jgi:HAD superfamily hydrolase (TIGR01459 family)
LNGIVTGFLDALPDRYRVILCDLWGCVHDGIAILPGVVERLDRWRDEGRQVIFLTNAPRPSSAVVAQLTALGLPDRLNGQVASSGDAALAWLADDDDRACTFIGAQADAVRLTAAGLRFGPEAAAERVICSGFDERGFDLADYDDQLRRLAARGVEMLCLNPDRLIHRGGRAEPCAGAIADAYQTLGGTVRQFGKPHPLIYDHAIRQAGNPNRATILAIGDSIATDVAGAAHAGIDVVFVAGGIDAAAYQTDGDRIFVRGSDTRRPIAVVPGLG